MERNSNLPFLTIDYQFPVEDVFTASTGFSGLQLFNKDEAFVNPDGSEVSQEDWNQGPPEEKINLGCGVSLSSAKWASLLKSGDRVFIKDLALIVFGHAVLARSSVTGKPSNRYSGKTGCSNQLCEEKMNLIRDWYEKYRSLKNLPIVSSRKITSFVNKYVAEKIATIRRKSRIRSARCNQILRNKF